MGGDEEVEIWKTNLRNSHSSWRKYAFAPSQHVPSIQDVPGFTWSFSLCDSAHTEARSLLTQQGHEPHDCEYWLSQQLHVGWVSIVDLESSSKCALGERVRVVAQEGIVIAEEHIAHGGTAVGKQQVLVLCNDLWM
jgi:hypothetical protein